MYIYIVVKRIEVYYKIKVGMEVKIAIEKATNESVLILPFEKLTKELIEELKPKAIIYGGFSEKFEEYEQIEFKKIHEIIEDIEIPMLCICGSHQLLGKLYNQNTNKKRFYDEPIRKVTKDDKGPLEAGERAGTYIAKGFFKIKKVKDDPIFEGLNEEIYLKCIHYCEMKELPEEFELLASTDHTEIEIIKHKNKLIYGVQCHIDQYEEPYLDGRKILNNFSKIVKTFWEIKTNDIKI